ncbi:MAG: hypothetical protein IE920_06105 [Thiotrichales bacterium]|nr:hypothetical protein [Thiotrichales bacterium]
MNTKETAQNLLWLVYGLLAITFFHLVYVVMPSLTLAFMTNTVLMFFILESFARVGREIKMRKKLAG